MNTFKDIFIDGNIDIVIPQLQRDYVQGQREDIISPLLSSLIDAITDQSKDEVHLNYIYGYSTEENGRSGFIPVDGQQRLTTLWLLHLYIYSKFPQLCGGEKFGVNLVFRAREYAGHFTSELKEHCLEVIGSNEIKKAISTAPWFISEWKYDRTVDSMLKTLSFIDKTMRNTQPDRIFLERISFQFLNMADLGLTDDIYVKMNGRGKPLTYFENLKSWMDSEGDIEWKEKIDNDWAAFFWENRNKNQKHPEEIDDEQQRLFYTLSLIYWLKHKDSLLININDLEDTINYLRSLPNGYSDSDSLPLEPTLDDIRAKIINILRVGRLAIPLYWVEKWGIFSKEVLEWIKHSLNVLADISNNVNNQNEKLYFNYDHSERTSLVYDIAMDNAYYESTIPFLYGLIRTPGNCKSDIHQWLRLLRNLILNSSIEYIHIGKAFNSIDILSDLISNNTEESPVLSTLRDLVNDNDTDTISKLSPFTKQLKEEMRKANIMNMAELAIVEDIENIHTFRGRVSFIFDFLKSDEWTVKNLESYRDILAVVFPNTKKNKTGFSDNLVRRVLVTYNPHFIGNDPDGGKWRHVGNGSEDWKIFLCNNDYNQCVKNMIDDIRKSCCEVSHSGIENQLKTILDSKTYDYTHYWHYFAKFSGVWSFMEDKLSSTWEDDSSNNIILLKKTRFGDNYDHAELRAYSLYLAWKNDSDLKKKIKARNWTEPVFWPHGKWDSQKNTCVFFEKTDEQGNKLAIDVYFRKTKADDFAIDLLLRKKDNTEEDNTTCQRIEKYFSNKKETVKELERYEFDGFNFVSQDTFSWNGIKEEFLRIVNSL